jgi:hypothetical protein
MSLREKLRQLQTDAQPADAGETIAAWRRVVADLYSKVQEYLADYASEGLVSFEIREVDRFEDQLGNYSIGQLVLSLGNQVVVFSPEARYAVGGDGRVDIYAQGYLARRVRLRWLPTPSPSGTWAISLEAWDTMQMRGHKTVRPLVKETLEEALELLLD